MAKCSLNLISSNELFFFSSKNNANITCYAAEHRCIESAKIRNKYPDRVPVSEIFLNWFFFSLYEPCLFCFFNTDCLPTTHCTIGDCGESVWVPDSGHWQEEVPGPLWHHSGSVHVDHQETHPAALWEGHLPVCGQDSPSVQVRTTIFDRSCILDPTCSVYASDLNSTVYDVWVRFISSLL